MVCILNDKVQYFFPTALDSLSWGTEPKYCLLYSPFPAPFYLLGMGKLEVCSPYSYLPLTAIWGLLTWCCVTWPPPDLMLTTFSKERLQMFKNWKEGTEIHGY